MTRILVGLKGKYYLQVAYFEMHAHSLALEGCDLGEDARYFLGLLLVNRLQPISLQNKNHATERKQAPKVY